MCSVTQCVFDGYSVENRCELTIWRTIQVTVMCSTEYWVNTNATTDCSKIDSWVWAGVWIDWWGVYCVPFSS
jgi:hypothetical protein